MIGDACAFLDPIFSTGVFLAMRSAERAAETVDAILRAVDSERVLQNKYQREVAHGLRTFSWFIFRFTTPAMGWLFANPRDTMGLERAMISMLGGDVFENRATLRRLHIFRALYLLRSFASLKQSIASAFARRHDDARSAVADSTIEIESTARFPAVFRAVTFQFHYAATR
jgi:hypothetical protein